MKQIRFLLIPAVVFFILLPEIFAETRCNCGTFSSGMYSYTVEGSGDCCKDTPWQYGTLDSYVQNANGTWALDASAPISGTSAQDHCCNIPS